ncbi:MAG: anthranilate synthase component I [Fusobacterium sp. JB019]|nr:anthranilate synthase component I [Fusobacterium sp. JB019]
MKLKTYEKIISGDIETPITLFKKYIKDEVGFLLESGEKFHPKGRYSFLGKPYMFLKGDEKSIRVQKDHSLKILKGNPFDIIKKYLDEIDVENTTRLDFVGGAVGAISYDSIRFYERIPNENKDEINTPVVDLLFTKEFLAYDHLYQKIHIVVLEEPTKEGEEKAEERIEEIESLINKDVKLNYELEDFHIDFKSNVTKEEFINNVKKAKDYIYAGDIFQVVLSQRFSGIKKDVDSLDLYRKLTQVNPSAYMYYLKMNNYEVIGSSPEMLVEVNNNIVKNCPIAGTRKISKDEGENKRIKEELLKDEKEISEHNMLVDLGRNDMGRIAKIGSVKVPNYLNVKDCSHVMHITSLVEGELREDKSIFDAFKSFFPAGTLSGAPKIRAMEIIDELENLKRGVYGGAVGYFGFNNTMDTCIAIRTIVKKDDVINIQAGAGIVYDSDPEAEYEETINKLRACVKAITGKEIL